MTAVSSWREDSMKGKRWPHNSSRRADVMYERDGQMTKGPEQEKNSARTCKFDKQDDEDDDDGSSASYDRE